MKEIFVYGTLLNDEVLEIILEYIPVKHSARLDGYKRVKVRGENYPAILADKNSEVEGALITALSDIDLKRLDEYEGGYYERIPVVVTMPGEVSQQCMTYVFRAEYCQLLSSEAWSNGHFREKHLQQFLRGNSF